MNHMDHLDMLIERSYETRTMPLRELIVSEHLEKYELGLEDILYADNLNNAIVPCYEFMILAREYYIPEQNEITAEYAVYSQHDHDGHNIINSLNMNAEYHLEFVGEETFDNMALAIAYAANLVSTITEHKGEK